MKKLVLLAVGAVAIAGCTLTLDQQKAVARQLGTAAAVTWIATDNPSAEDIAAMKDVVAKIQAAACTNCSTDTSYYARVYPVVDEYITANVKPDQQAMARLGAAFLLSGMDTAFAMNPEWKADADNAAVLVEAFCEGANAGLMLPADSSVLAAARGQTQLRAKLNRVR